MTGSSQVQDGPDDSRQKRVAAIITEAMRSAPRSRRHPCEVTSDRLGDHLDQYTDKLSGADRDSISHVRHLLEQLAEGGDH